MIRGRHRARAQCPPLLLWVAAGAVLAGVALRGEPLAEPSPPQRVTQLEVGPLDSCPSGWTASVTNEASTTCVRARPVER